MNDQTATAAVRDRIDVAIIGAGPSGSVAAALLNARGHRCLVLEREVFPRFSIGESLLPQCMAFIEQAGMLPAVEAAGFQFKNGAVFSRGDALESFDFNDKTSAGWGTTFQVQRAQFDQILAQQAADQGVEIRFGHRLTDFQTNPVGACLSVVDDQDQPYQAEAKFVLDASGFGRVLPRLLDLELAPRLERRTAFFTHIRDAIDDPRFDRNKILLCIHPRLQDVWFWLIPFSDGRASIGVVVANDILESLDCEGESPLRYLIAEVPLLARLLDRAEFDLEIRSIEGYSADVKRLYGPNFALLGNAGEFLDPIFSSGVTIAMKSATLAACVLDRQLRGQQPDWEREYSAPLRQGVDAFRHFVERWYDGRLQDIIFSVNKNPAIKRMLCSVLAGYAWDGENPYVQNGNRLDTLATLCQQQ